MIKGNDFWVLNRKPFTLNYCVENRRSLFVYILAVPKWRRVYPWRAVPVPVLQGLLYFSYVLAFLKLTRVKLQYTRPLIYISLNNNSDASSVRSLRKLQSYVTYRLNAQNSFSCIYFGLLLVNLKFGRRIVYYFRCLGISVSCYRCQIQHCTLYKCVGLLWRTRNITIVAILIQWHANKWPGILNFSRTNYFF